MARPAVDRWISSQGWLEPVGDLEQRIVGGFYGALGGFGRALKNVAHGTWPLAHPLHPAVVAIPLGAWTVGVVADYAALASRAVPTRVGDFALIIGLLGAAVSAWSGLTDHHETYGQERRVATLHGLVMTSATVLFLVSLLLRWFAGPDIHGLAVALATIGLLGALVGGYLGGHLTFGYGTAVNRNAFTEPQAEWTAVGRADQFGEGVLRSVTVGPAAVLVVRRDGRLLAIGDTCSHAGGPLHEGTLEGDEVICPWHGSRFCLRDGSLRGGPATFPQPRYEVREVEGRVEARAEPGP
jgi:nitrite reductase/ring-hydroxylating ferredoxin subunit/uncharacterized membrane protein